MVPWVTFRAAVCKRWGRGAGVREDGLVYKAVGDTVVLTAVSQEKHITSIQWKQVPDIAAEWSGGLTTYYSHFKGRSALDVSTGALTITGVTADHSGTYTAEINYNIANSLELLVISSVSKPNISTWCDPEMTSCNLTCEGDTTGAKPVTFSWRLPGGFVNSTKVLTITMDKTETSYSCIVENPVSREESAAIPDPFPQKRNRMWILLCIIPLAAVIGIVIVIARVLIFKFKSRKGWTPVDQKQPNQTTDREATGRGATDHEATNHETTALEATDRGATDHEATNHETTALEATDRGATDRGATDHEATNHEATNHETTALEATDRGATDQKQTNHETTVRETTNHETTALEATDRGATDHEATNHETTARETTGCETTALEATDRGATDHEATNHETTARETTGCETTNQKQTNHETTVRETTNRETTDQETTDQETTDQETTDQKQTDHETTDHETNSRETTSWETTDQKQTNHETTDCETTDLKKQF
uniref:Ig-like domain-containing protein n=1 Tax=Gasterosteus aculeatus aculeatus TaxID=481459 RepID=A0AAQ4NVG8_GASAC